MAATGQTVWSGNPALDIIDAARSANVAWIMMGYHRGKMGSEPMGGVVRDVFATARSLPINVGVFIHGTDRPIERVFAACDAGPDGRAVLDIAVPISQKNKCKLRVLLVSNSAAEREDELVEMMQKARARMGRRFHTDVLTERSLHQLFRQTPGRLLVVGRKFAEEVGLPLDEVPGGDRCVIVVHGAEPDSPEPAGAVDRR
jgi:hypothetical protein